MNLSDIPGWIAKVFGADASSLHIRGIPVSSADPNAASLSLGFPPNTFADISAGGTPPDGRDFNGILNLVSAHAQWAAVGGAARWSSAIATSIGGYPAGALVMSATTVGLYYVSLTDNNTQNPATGSNWFPLVLRAATPAQVKAQTANDRVVTPAGLAGLIFEAATATELRAGALANKVATAKALKDAGVDYVIEQSLIANKGYRLYASGLMECWGNQLFNANSTTLVPYPKNFTSWSNAVVSGSYDAVNSQDNTVAVSSTSPTGFVAFSARDTQIRGWWQAKGV